MTRTVLLRLIALLVAFALVAAACGGDDDDESGGDTGDDTTTTEDDSAEGDDSGAADGDGGAADGDGGAADGDGADADDAADGDDGAEEPVAAPSYGGEISVGLEAESDGWLVPGQQCAVSCHTVMRAIYDPLMTEGPDGLAVPYLLESLEPLNAECTQWEATIRDGITFHDGTPADGAALVRFFEELKTGTITGLILRDFESIEQSGPLSVTSTYSVPQCQLPDALTGQLGYLTAPSQFDDPEGSSNPVGTGPFTFVSWSPGESLVVQRNENYWRTDADGNALPYLDQVTFRPIPDVSARRDATESGSLQVNHDSFGENFLFWQNDWEGNVITDQGFQETTYLLINNDDEVMGDPRVRRALALCLDRDLYIQLRVFDGAEKANGPFAPGMIGYLEDTGFPDFDPEAGQALVEEVAADNGGSFPEIAYATTNVPSNLLTAEFITGNWRDNCGIPSSIAQIEQAAFIGTALGGAFQVFLWRNHGFPNPAGERIWWTSEFTEGLATNFGRIRNPIIDQAMLDMQNTEELADLTGFAEETNRAFAEEVNNIWLNWTNWAVPYSADLAGVGPVTLPDSGEKGLAALSGRVFLTEAYFVN